MVTLNLRTVHRILLRGMIDSDGKAGNHTLSELGKLMKILEKVAFTEEEVKILDLRLVGEPGSQSFVWNKNKDNDASLEEVDVEKPFELSDEESGMICDIIKKKNESKEFSMQEAGPVVEIATQLGVAL